MALVKCGSCGNQISEKAAKCPKCGVVTGEKCSECGVLNAKDAAECKECGHPFSAAVVVSGSEIVEAKCRHCDKIFTFEKKDFEPDVELTCPHCDEEDTYPMMKTCPKCNRETLFHLGNISDTLMEIGGGMVKGFIGGVLNPTGALLNLGKQLSDNSEKPKDGRRGVCSFCATEFIECPFCYAINPGETKITCKKCSKVYASP